MRFLQSFLVVMLLAVLVGPVRAEDDADKPAGDRPDRGAFRQKMIEEFDADGDGKLSDEERETAREAMRERRGQDGFQGKRKGGKDRPKKGPGNGFRGGKDRPGPPDPNKLFELFDADGDDQLSRDEFMKLSEFMREQREKWGPGAGGPGERRGERRGRPGGPPDGPGDRPGPPPGERRDFRPPGPLQNPGDGPGPDFRESANRRGGPDGQGPRNFEGRRPPNPDMLFDRFDKNDDDQLSREEFMELTEAMRNLRERFGQGRERAFGGGRDRGDRPGPPGPPDRGGPDGPRPPRPDSDEGADSDGPLLEDDTV
ncbi:MAG: EF-hand domain-containing protein [Planctomycetales bacterium]|nr:EF-hand domain-containing protein [Planctomycetales bacterium]